jgi:MSHA pilin protein MshA
MFKSQKGFTLIELVIVIVVLGILAGIAIPKYISIQRDARIASVNGIAGGIRGAVALARAKYLVNQNTTIATVDMDSTLVTCAVGSGIPTGDATGIVAAMQDVSGYTVTYPTGTTVRFTPPGGNANCQATYDGTTGIVTPDVTVC